MMEKIFTITVGAVAVKVFDSLPNDILSVYNTDKMSVEIIHTAGGTFTGNTFTCSMTDDYLTNVADLPIGALSSADKTALDALVPSAKSFIFRMDVSDIHYLGWEITANAPATITIIIKLEKNANTPVTFTSTNQVDATVTGGIVVNQSATAVAAMPADVVAGTENDLITTLKRALITGGYDFAKDGNKIIITDGTTQHTMTISGAKGLLDIAVYDAAGAQITDFATQTTLAEVDSNLGDVTDAATEGDTDGTAIAKLRGLALNLGLIADAADSTGTAMAKLRAIADSLAIIDDWDESDRAAVNLIAGQVGISAGTGIVDALTPKVTIASDDFNIAAMNTSLGVIAGWDNTASDGANVTGPVSHDAANTAANPVKQGGVGTDSQRTPVDVEDVVEQALSTSGEVISRAHNYPTKSDNVTETDSVDRHHNVEELVNETDQTANTYYYPSSDGISLEEGKSICFDVELDDAIATVEAKTGVNTGWKDITVVGYDLLTDTSGNASYDATGTLLNTLLDFEGLTVSDVRLAIELPDATNAVVAAYKIRST